MIDLDLTCNTGSLKITRGGFSSTLRRKPLNAVNSIKRLLKGSSLGSIIKRGRKANNSKWNRNWRPGLMLRVVCNSTDNTYIWWGFYKHYWVFENLKRTVKQPRESMYSIVITTQAAQTHVTREGCNVLHTISDAPVSRYRRPLTI